MKHIGSGLGACIGMFLLILDSKTALTGARDGIALCVHNVIPSLFPFLILSTLLLDASANTPIAALRPLGKLCRIPAGTESLLIPAFIGGYPVGAGAVGTAWRTGQLQKEDAQRMLGFCNNCGPAFLFGTGAALFPSISMVWALWGIHLAGAILAARLLPAGLAGPVLASRQKKKNSSDILSASIRVMSMICGWVVLFRVVIAFLTRWILWLLPVSAQVFLTGLLELTNGCCELPRIADIRLRFTVFSCLLALGGLCIGMQTVSVTEGLSLKYYYRGKLIQALFSLFVCGCLFSGKWAVFCGLAVFFALILGQKQKRGSIPKTVGV